MTAAATTTAPFATTSERIKAYRAAGAAVRAARAAELVARNAMNDVEGEAFWTAQAEWHTACLTVNAAVVAWDEAYDAI